MTLHPNDLRIDSLRAGYAIQVKVTHLPTGEVATLVDAGRYCTVEDVQERAVKVLQNRLAAVDGGSGWVPCEHLSWTGESPTADSPNKVWICDGCGIHKTSGQMEAESKRWR